MPVGPSAHRGMSAGRVREGLSARKAHKGSRASRAYPAWWAPVAYQAQGACKETKEIQETLAHKGPTARKVNAAQGA